MKKYITDVINDEYLQWEKGDMILINAGTGTGKSYFIKNKLDEHCLQNGKKILYLTNRDTLKDQVKNDLGNITCITAINYQKVEAQILNNIYFNNYNYVVMDESHYFFTDSAFNKKTDLFFKRMLNDNSICKILMTATPIILLKYFKDYNIKVDYKYELKTDYSYIDQVICFNTYESIDSIIEDIPEDEQIMFFTSAKRAYETAKKFNGTFICSKHNKKGMYNRYIKGTENEEELSNIIENSKFNSHLLCTTTALDNGINIKEGTPVKHIIIDILDRDIFIQCLGRKRVDENEKINLYFYGYNDNKKINGFKSKIANSLNRANFLLEKGEIEYTQKKFKQDIVDGRIIDEIIINKKIHKVVNECIYTKYQVDLLIYNSILSKKYPTTYKKMIAIALGIDEDNIIELETKIEKQSLEDALEYNVGRKLYKKDRKEMIEFIGLKDLRGRLQKSVGQLNEYLKANKLPYIIMVPKRKSYRDENGKVKKEKTYWLIGKIVYDS